MAVPSAIFTPIAQPALNVYFIHYSLLNIFRFNTLWFVNISTYRVNFSIDPLFEGKAMIDSSLDQSRVRWGPPSWFLWFSTGPNGCDSEVVLCQSLGRDNLDLVFNYIFRKYVLAALQKCMASPDLFVENIFFLRKHVSKTTSLSLTSLLCFSARTAQIHCKLQIFPEIMMSL